MPWTKPQIRAAAIAARHAGWNEQQRGMALSSLGNRAVHGGRATSKSPRLNQDDYEQYMATAEASAGGTLPGFTPGYWYAKATDIIQRQRHAIRKLAADADVPSEAYLDGMIDKATGGKATSLDDLDRLNDRRVAAKVIDLLKSKKRQAARRTGPHNALEADAIPF
jgi:hypothetical protein